MRPYLPAESPGSAGVSKLKAEKTGGKETFPPVLRLIGIAGKILEKFLKSFMLERKRFFLFPYHRRLRPPKEIL